MTYDSLWKGASKRADKTGTCPERIKICRLSNKVRPFLFNRGTGKIGVKRRKGITAINKCSEKDVGHSDRKILGIGTQLKVKRPDFYLGIPGYLPRV